MTKYYSNHPDFSAGLQASSMTGSVSYARSQVTNALSDIKEVTEVVQNEGLSFLYSPVGGCGARKGDARNNICYFLR